MEVLEAIRDRRSIRRYAERDIPREVLRQVLEAGRWAPSWANAQPWRFVLVTDPETIAALGEAEHSSGQAVRRARAVIAVCGVRGRSGYIKGELVREQGDWWYLFDLGMAVQNMSLAAHALGLGSVVIGWLDAGRVREVLQVPPEVEVVCLLALGYPAEEKEPQGRRLEPEQVFFGEGYGRPLAK